MSELPPTSDSHRSVSLTFAPWLLALSVISMIAGSFLAAEQAYFTLVCERTLLPRRRVAAALKTVA
jgi:hypothetical protein